jgi:Na+-driven multidrug efflux pump
MNIFHRLKYWNKRLDNRLSEWRFKSKCSCLVDASITVFIALVIYLIAQPYLPFFDKEEGIKNITSYNIVTIFIFYPLNTFLFYKYNLKQREKYKKKAKKSS